MLLFAFCQACSVWVWNPLSCTGTSWWDRNPSWLQRTVASQQTSLCSRFSLERDQNPYLAAHLPCSPWSWSESSWCSHLPFLSGPPLVTLLGVLLVKWQVKELRQSAFKNHCMAKKISFCKAECAYSPFFSHCCLAAASRACRLPLGLSHAHNDGHWSPGASGGWPHRTQQGLALQGERWGDKRHSHWLLGTPQIHPSPSWARPHNLWHT